MVDAGEGTQRQEHAKPPTPKNEAKGKAKVPFKVWFPLVAVVLVVSTFAYPILMDRGDQAELRREAEQFVSTLDDCVVQGAWHDNTRFIESIVVLCELGDGGIQTFRAFKDGSVMVGDGAYAEPAFRGLFVVESTQRYETFGDHLIVLESGELEFWDREGLISTATPIRGVN